MIGRNLNCNRDSVEINKQNNIEMSIIDAFKSIDAGK